MSTLGARALRYEHARLHTRFHKLTSGMPFFLTHIASIEAFRFVFDSFEHIELRYHEHMSMRCWSAGGRGTTLGTIMSR